MPESRVETGHGLTANDHAAHGVGALSQSLAVHSQQSRRLALPFPPRTVAALLILLIIALFLRLLAIYRVPLIPEEAYYWVYAQHPNLSYYDHPPMVAWVIAAGTHVFGNTEFGVRVVGTLLMFAASWLLFLFGRAWFGWWTGLLSAVMLHVLPAYYWMGFLTTMDSALIFFWALALVGVTIALRRGHAWGWYLAGVGLGGALLSKYTGVFIVAGAVLPVLVHRPWRRHLRSVHPYLALLLGAALFSPVIIWNAQHNWASFRFQFLSRWQHASISATELLSFAGFQILVAPTVLIAITHILVRRTRKGRMLQPRWIIALCFSVPLILMMSYASLRKEIHIDWTAPAYLSLIPATTWWLLARLRAIAIHPGARRSRWEPSVAWICGACMLISMSGLAYLLTLQPRTQTLAAFGPWRELAAIVEREEDLLEGHEPLIVGSGKYKMASLMAFYRTPLEPDVRAADYTTNDSMLIGGQGLGYTYWATPKEWSYEQIIFVADSHARLLEVGRRYTHVRVLYDSGKRYPRRYQVALCQGLRT